jgi:hypothetical protein
MGFGLRAAVQIKAGVDRLKTARESLFGAPVNGRKRRQGRCGSRRKNRRGNRFRFGGGFRG